MKQKVIPVDQIDFTQFGVSQDMIDQIQDRYDNLSAEEQADFNKNYRKHTVQSFIAGGYKPFVKFFNILPIGNSGASMGRGEIQILLAVNGSQTGGTATHDIVMSDGQWEVKEVGKLRKDNQKR
jgi:hypothetical protein